MKSEEQHKNYIMVNRTCTYLIPLTKSELTEEEMDMLFDNYFDCDFVEPENEVEMSYEGDDEIFALTLNGENIDIF